MPVTKFAHPDPYSYQNGFGSYFEYVRILAVQLQH